MVYGDNPDERVQVIPVERPATTVLNRRTYYSTRQLGDANRGILHETERTLVPDGCGMGGGWFVKQLFIVQARPDHPFAKGFRRSPNTSWMTRSKRKCWFAAASPWG